MHCPRCAVVIGLGIVFGCLPAGCSRKDEPPKPRRLSGIIDDLDLDNSEVTVRYYNEKQGAETTLTGSITEDTEISINGVLSNLEQLRVGERVDVVGMVRVRQGRREVVATRIQVRRAETIRRTPAERSTPGATSESGSPGNAQDEPPDTGLEEDSSANVGGA